MTYMARLSLISVLTLAFATVVFLSLDINRYRDKLYTAELSPKPGAGMLKLVFYGNRYFIYSGDSSIRFSGDDWEVTKNSDSTVLTARTDRSTVKVSAYGAPVYVGLLRFPDGGSAILTEASGKQQEIDLRSPTEGLQTLTFGGEDSSVPAVVGSDLIPSFYSTGIYLLIIAVFALLAFSQMRPGRAPCVRGEHQPRALAELLGYAAPLIAASLFVQAAYWPAGVAHDGGLQWSEAVTPGHLTPALVIPATLFFRVFAGISSSPAYLIAVQIVLASLGVALILREIRKRGLSRRAAQLGAIGIALLPQYATFFCTLSKDAWNCVGLLWAAYAALSLLRHHAADRRFKSVLLALLTGLCGIFAGLMRPNTLPAVLVFMLLLAVYFSKGLGAKSAAALFAGYVGIALLTPTAVIYLSAEAQAQRSATAATTGVSDHGGYPLAEFANLYVFHLFAAALHDGVAIDPKDAAVFYKVAPEAAWREYDCSYVDKTLVSVGSSAQFDPLYFAQHRGEMALIVVKLLVQNPAVLIHRQACVTRLLWYIGYRDSPFQTNATVGYDESSVPAAFIATAGDNRSLIGKVSRQFISDYISWSESPTHLWIFWKPFLYTCLGLFSVLIYSLSRKQYDVLLVAALPVMLTLLLAVVIPFPAFRYQYPATLLFTLLFLFSFARPVARSTDLSAVPAPPGALAR